MGNCGKYEDPEAHSGRHRRGVARYKDGVRTNSDQNGRDGCTKVIIGDDAGALAGRSAG